MLLEGIDYTIENGLWVFTKEYHLKRGHCCKSMCKNCPWEYKKKVDRENDNSGLDSKEREKE